MSLVRGGMEPGRSHSWGDRRNGKRAMYWAGMGLFWSSNISDNTCTEHVFRESGQEGVEVRGGYIILKSGTKGRGAGVRLKIFHFCL